MARSVFTPWKCGDCGAHGAIRHLVGATAAEVALRTATQHSIKSPECHQRGRERMMAQAHQSAQLSPRDRHIIVTARIKRKVMAEALRVQRAADREAAAVLTDLKADAAAAYRRGKTRREWLAGKVGRKGYAFT